MKTKFVLILFLLFSFCIIGCSQKEAKTRIENEQKTKEIAQESNAKPKHSYKIEKKTGTDTGILILNGDTTNVIVNIGLDDFIKNARKKNKDEEHHHTKEEWVSLISRLKELDDNTKELENKEKIDSTEKIIIYISE